jgi:hypothetical protein
LSLAGIWDFALHSPSWTLTRQNWNEEFRLPSSLTSHNLRLFARQLEIPTRFQDIVPAYLISTLYLFSSSETGVEHEI